MVDGDGLGRNEEMLRKATSLGEDLALDWLIACRVKGRYHEEPPHYLKRILKQNDKNYVVYICLYNLYIHFWNTGISHSSRSLRQYSFLRQICGSIQNLAVNMTSE